MIKKKHGWVIQALVMSISMGFVMSFVMTLVNIGLVDKFFKNYEKKSNYFC